jgi:N-acetylglucosamine-6-phosphate deacetylase
VRCKPADGWVLVSDGVAAVGQGPGPLRLFGSPCVADAAVRRSDDGRLAGSCIALADAVRNLHGWLPRLPLETILAAASTVPAAVIGRADRCGVIAEGRDAEMVVLDDRLRLRRALCPGQ